MTTTANLKPGDVVRQPAHGYGIVYVDSTGETLVMHCSAKGRISIADLAGWERVETVKPGHVQVRVDDLNLGTTAGRVSAIERLYEVFTPPQPDEPTEFGAKVSVTLDGGEKERFISCADGWILTNPSTPNFQSQPWHWDYLIDRGTVSLGWDDES